MTLPHPLSTLAQASRKSTTRLVASTLAAAFLALSPACRAPDLPTSAATRPYLLLDQSEAARHAGDDPQARAAYRDLLEWAASDPLADGWGATALVPYALWRWTQYTSEAVEIDLPELDRILDAEEILRHTKLFTVSFSYPILDTLPQLQEAYLLSLAVLAQRAGRTDHARRLFINYLSVTRDATLPLDALAMRDAIVRDGWATLDALELLRGNRLWQLGRFDQAELVFRRLAASPEDAVQQEARLNLATLRFEIHDDNLSFEMRREVSDVLGTILTEARDPQILQRAYFQRGRIQRREGAAQSIPGFVSDMETLANEFPTGEYTADALYELAQYSEAQFRLTHENDWLVSALSYYARIRNLPEPHTREDSMYFRPALALYTRSLINDITSVRDLRRAQQLLTTLIVARPSGPFFLAANFWLARIAESLGESAKAAALYEQLAQIDTFGYYGVRALMHLDPEADPLPRILPSSNARHRLACSIPKLIPNYHLEDINSLYHVRVKLALESGRYLQGLDGLRRFRARTAMRVRDAPLSDLDNYDELANIAMLLAMRQDVVSARDRDRTGANVVALGATVGRDTGDWPLVFSLLPNGGWTRSVATAVRSHQGYVQVAYPPLYLDDFTRVAAEFDLIPSVLYGLARRESLFDSTAVSVLGATGFYQFMPETFRRLDLRWGLLVNAGVSSAREYLIDETRSIELAGRYLREELLARYSTDQGLLFALMDHSGGASAVRSWSDEWTKIGQTTDVEYMVETARFVETRILVRGILGDVAVVEAAGLFEREELLCGP